VAQDALLNNSMKKTTSSQIKSPRKTNENLTLINNTVFNGMCAIFFDLRNGTTGVFGLNTFVNWVGFGHCQRP